MIRSSLRALAALVLLAPTAAPAHDGASHATQAEARAHLAARPAWNGVEMQLPPPPAEAAPAFRLIDHTGALRRHEDFRGRPYLLFFGYAVNQAICTVSIAQLAQVREILAEAGYELDVLLVTLDPTSDTPEAMRRALPELDPKLIGLTGGEKALAAARRAFAAPARRESELVDGTPVFSHTSLVYLVGPEGDLRAVVPPAMSADRLAEVLAGQL
jgi:protein SCO1/2